MVRLKVALPLLLLVTLPGGVTAQLNDLSVSWAAFLGGGYSGKSEPRLVKFERLTSSGTVDPDSVEVGRDTSWRWRPTLTLGAEARFGDDQGDDDFYWGIGGFMSTLSDAQNDNAVAPGLALILHGGPVGVMFGYVFTASDDIVIPGEAERLTVPRDNFPDFSTPGTRSLGRLFIGFRGVTLSF